MWFGEGMSSGHHLLPGYRLGLLLTAPGAAVHIFSCVLPDPYLVPLLCTPYIQTPPPYTLCTPALQPLHPASLPCTQHPLLPTSAFRIPNTSPPHPLHIPYPSSSPSVPPAPPVHS